MNATSLRVHAVQAAILFFREKIPSREQILAWKKNRISIALIQPMKKENPAREKLNTLNDLIDVSCYAGDQSNAAEENHEQACLKTIMEKLDIPSGRIVLITDDPQFVRPASQKKMAMVIGINDNRGKKFFYDNGSSLVCENIEAIDLFREGNSTPVFSQSLPNIFSGQNKLQTQLNLNKLVFFFDYDGTLTPIVKDPAKATLGQDTRELLQKLSNFYHIAVISGRDMDDIRDFIQLDSIIYAGSHGFRISGPDGISMEHEQARKLLSELDEFENLLKNSLDEKIPGIQVERKRYAIAVHYRNADQKDIQPVKEKVDELLGKFDNFKKGKGKKIIEVKPSTDWHKGKAVEWIMNELGHDYPGEFIPVYVGDDITDEDAFRVLADDGLGILVGEHSEPSAADYRLRDVEQVKQFMHYIIQTASSGRMN